MPATRRELTMADVAEVIAFSTERPDARDAYRAVERISAEAVGWRLFTVLRYVEAAGAVERLYSSDEKAYPVGGRKPLDKITASHGAMDKGEVFLAATKEEVRKAFFDHELIFSLGITAILNAPISANGRRLGTLALSGLSGMYGRKEVERSMVLAGLLAPALMAEVD